MTLIEARNKPSLKLGLFITAAWTTACLLQPQPAAAQSSSPSALQQATELAKQIEARTGAAPATANLPADDPCTILSARDLNGVFPGVSAPERSRRLEKYGTTECQWKGPDGQVILVVQQSMSASASTASKEARGMADGFVDPMNRKALDGVRLQKFGTLGIDNAAFVESADPARGILSDGAFIALVSGRQVVTLLSRNLASQDRAAALKALERLGSVAANRIR